jgi:ADP-heptose:LPS heptosyltransferase
VALTRPRVVIDRSLGLGDLCTAVPAIRAVANGYPEHELALAVPGWLAPLARRVGADTVVPVTGLQPLPDGLRQPAVAVNLHGRGPESIERLVALEPQELISFRHENVTASDAGPLWIDDEHEVHRWCRLVASSGLRVDPADILIDVPDAAADPADRPYVVVHPGAASCGRRWPGERFADVVRHLSCRSWSVLVTGSEAERGLADEVIRRAGVEGVPGVARPRSVAGSTDLCALIRLIAGAALVVSNDTGVAHLATATSTPSVVLFGPTSPARWGPPPGGRHRAIWRGLVGDPHANSLDPGLAAISVDEVIAEVDGQLATVARR